MIEPHVGKTTYSLQHRCTQWGRHSYPHNRPYPCEGCYSLVQVTVVVPYAQFVPFSTLHEGTEDLMYHHESKTRFTKEEAEAAVGKRAEVRLTGTIVESREGDAGPLVLFLVDERFGFGEMRLGGDLELFEVVPT